MQALDIYRERFEPSQQLQKPHAMPGVNVIVAETDAEAQRLFTSLQMRFVGMVRGDRGLLQPPIDDIETYWTPSEKIHAQRMLACAFVGSPATVKSQLDQFIAKTGADELMVACAVFDHTARLRSYELLAGL
jgi:alkanesulfonate monooxygenase SsuD/methylene tetrahydromethanopterin reductase-like flavin-dependent oxidoreductase (luciferase family)